MNGRRKWGHEDFFGDESRSAEPLRPEVNNDVDWNLLAKYIFGECIEEEEEKVRAWMERDPKRIAFMRQLRRALQNQENPISSERWDTDALWERVRERTQPGESEETGASSFPSSPSMPAPGEERRRETGDRERRPLRKRNRLSSGRAVWGGAIALLIAIIVIGTLWQRGTPDPGPRTASGQEVDTFTTQKGERAIIRLTDGSRVQLNVDSRLTVPSDFGRQTRRIELEGEAFFEVETDSTRPFIVRSGEVTTRVLGTAFDVNAYPEDEETRVVVSEGKVSLRADADEDGAKDRAGEERVVLTQRQMARITRKGNRIVRQESDVFQHLAWMEGHLVLRKAPFREVVQKLERWYDLEISLAEGTVAPPGHLNSRFAEDQPLDEVLSVVVTAFGLEYQRHQKHVTLSSGGGSPLNE